MKKFFLAMSLIGTMFLMNSCLDSGESSYTGNMEYAYVTSDITGLVYARAFGGMITSPEIQNLTPGYCYLISYSWTSSNGSVASSEGYQINKVTVLNNLSEKDKIPFTQLILSNALDGLTTPATAIYFPPAYSPTNYFGDYWAFSYRWKKKEGETATLQFYKADDSTSDKVIIDIRFVKSGTATGTEEKTQDDLIAVNMSSLRSLLGPTTGTSTVNIPIVFRYYEENKSSLTTTNTTTYYMTVYKN